MSMSEKPKNEKNTGISRPPTALGKFAAERARAAAEKEAHIDYWRREATHDDLTKLLNRRGFMLEAEEILKEHPSPENLALLVLDLDKLKRLNDESGHPAGDAGIKAAGQFLRQHLRGSDLVARNIEGRVGGDEYYALIDLTPRDEGGEQTAGERLAQLQARIGEEFSRDVTQQDERFIKSGLGISVGGVLYTEGVTMDDWIRQADDLMYQQKEARGDARRE